MKPSSGIFYIYISKCFTRLTFEIAMIPLKRFFRALILESTFINHTLFINLTNYMIPIRVNRKENYIINDSIDDNY